MLHTCCFPWNNYKNVRWHSSFFTLMSSSNKNSFFHTKTETGVLFTDHFLGELDENKREKVETSADYDSWDRVVDKALVVFGWYEGCFQCVGKLEKPIRDLKQSNKTPISFSFFLYFILAFNFVCSRVCLQRRKWKLWAWSSTMGIPGLERVAIWVDHQELQICGINVICSLEKYHSSMTQD